MKERYYEYDILRIIACICVVTIHTIGKFIDIPVDTRNWNIMNLAELVIRFSVCIFFMISGALYLNRDSVDIKKLFKNNILKLIVFYFAWSLIYFLSSLYRCTYANVDEVLADIVSGGGAYQLWFVSAIIMVYLLFPVLSDAIYGRPINVRYLVCLFCITICYKTISIIPDCPVWIITFMDRFSPDYFVYAGYALLGYYLSNHRIIKNRFLLVLIFIINTILFSFLSYRLCMYKAAAVQDLYTYLIIPQFINAICFFSFFSSEQHIYLSNIKAKIISELSACTLGVYAIHVKLLTIGLSFIWCPSAEASIKAVFVYILAINVVSFLIIFVLKRIPFLRKLVI